MAFTTNTRFFVRFDETCWDRTWFKRTVRIGCLVVPGIQIQRVRFGPFNIKILQSAATLKIPAGSSSTEIDSTRVQLAPTTTAFVTEQRPFHFERLCDDVGRIC